MKPWITLIAGLAMASMLTFNTGESTTDAADELQEEKTVVQVFAQEDPKECQVITGAIATGNITSLMYHDQKSMEFTSGNNSVEVELQYTVSVLHKAINQAYIRLCMDTPEAGRTIAVKVFNWNTGSYEFLSQQVVFENGISEVYLPAPTGALVSDAGEVKIRIISSGNSSHTLILDQAQLVFGYAASEDVIQAQNYKVSDGQLEQGVLDAATSFLALEDRDNTMVNVSSVSNKVAWHTVLPLYQEKSNIQTIRIDYSGNASTEVNPIWLSLYRFDTKNWEAIGMIPATTNCDNHTFYLSGEKLQSYISDDCDIRIRLYNSGTQSFVRSTDYLNVTVYSGVPYSQKTYLPSEFMTEYGTSEGPLENLAVVDGNVVSTQSNSSNKAAVQYTFQTDVDAQTIRELSFTIVMKSAKGVNPQYISLLNQQTNRFTVIKTLTGNSTYETVHVTLDSLEEIRKYMNADGQLVLRIYNSASAAFTRTVDCVQMAVTYGGFTSFTIAQVSDVHELIGTDNFKSIITEINQNVLPAFTVVSGDISDHGTPEQYALYLQDRQLLQNPVYTTPGNHDVRWWNANGKKTFTDLVGPLYQSFDYGGVHFVLLDSTVNFELDGKINKAQLEWLKQDMASVPGTTPVIWFAHHPFKINNNITARHELLEAAKGHNVIAYMSGHVHYYGNVIEDGIPVNYITYVKDNANQEFVSIEFTPNYYYIYKHKASDHSKSLWLTGRMDNTRQMDFSISRLQQTADGSLEISVAVNHAPDEVAAMQARIDNYGTYVPLINQGNGVWTGSINTNTYGPQLVNGTHFAGVEAFDNNGLKWTTYMDYEAPDAQIQKKWVFETGDMIQSSATLHGNYAYVGSNDGNLYCIDAQTGLEVWRYETNGAVISKPAIAGSSVIFGSGDMHVYCLDAQTGLKNWEYAAGGSVLSDPLVFEERIYFGCGDGRIYCLHTQTGELIWQYQTEGLMRQRPVEDNGTLYAFVRDTHIWYALDASTGQLKWRGEAGTDESLFVCGDVRPVIAGGKLWCIDAQNTRPGYLNPENGQLAWTGSLEKVSSRGMATDGTLVFYSSNNGRQITAYNAATDEIVWQKDLRYNNRDADLQEMQIDSGLVYDNGVIFHVAERGRITALNPANGDILWCYDAAGYPERVFWSTPEVSGNLVLASGIDGKLYAVEFDMNE